MTSENNCCRRNTRVLMAAFFFSCSLLCINSVNGAPPRPEGYGDSRRFVFHYHVTITDLPPGKMADIWIPLAVSDAHQTIAIRNAKLPGTSRKTKESRYGNAMFFLQSTADSSGRIAIAVDYDVQRKPVSPSSGEMVAEAERKLFLRANSLVPVLGKPFERLLDGKRVGTSRMAVRSIYDRVDRHVRYDKPAGGKWGRGDAAWVCDSRYGNCSDFHSLFISLCRSNGVPARFRIGFPISEEAKGSVGGYHCWAEFADDKRWFSVDISEADKHAAYRDFYFGHLPPDRVLFSTGRDLMLEPKQKSGPVNFFVYPHVEINGMAHTRLTTRFSFEATR